MFSSRRLDEKQLIMLKQGKGFFHIGAAGHEAVEIAAANCLKPGHDYAYPYYRDQAFCIGLGMTSREILLSFLAKKDDPNSSGRQMPQHFGSKKINIVSQSSPTGSQYLQAVGAAFVLKRKKNTSLVYVSSGEGTTSQGDFHEALNWASKDKAPVIFHIQDNGYAISVPINEQTSGGSVYNICSGYENLSRFNIDGTNFFESHLAFKKAIGRMRGSDNCEIYIVTSPEGFHYTHKIFVTDNNNDRYLVRGKTTDNTYLPKQYIKLLESIKEIELILGTNYLDIEFGITRNWEVVVFQVRPLTTVKLHNIKKLENKF